MRSARFFAPMRPGTLARSLPLLFALLLTPAIAFSATPFIHETLDTGTERGTSLELDPQGGAHLSYQVFYSGLPYLDITDGELRYGVKRGGVWTRETADTIGSSGWYSSLALDPSGNPHISHFDWWNNKLRYSTRSGSAWTSEIVDLAYTGTSSIAVDAEGNPHICYSGGADILKYATKKNGVWTIQTVDGTQGAGRSCSIALDPTGIPFIAYYSATTTDLRCAHINVGGWVGEVVDNAGVVGMNCSIALDGAGNPAISYWDLDNDNLKYARELGNVWSVETVDAQNLTGYYNSLALDTEGNPHIGYSQFNVLRYAAKLGGSWILQTVDGDGSVGQANSIALDSYGNPLISYYSNVGNATKFADSRVHLISPRGGERWTAGSQQTVRWSGAGPVDIQLSVDGGLSYLTLLTSTSQNSAGITVPSIETEHARFRIVRASPYSVSESVGDISIATDLVSPWWSTTVDAPGNVGYYSSLALDTQGHPRIAYANITGPLKFAARNGDVWAAEVVDATAVVGSMTSTAVDPQGDTHIAYFEYNNSDLKYASKSNGAWTLETVDAAGNVGQFPSLAFDAQGSAHVSYVDSNNFSLKYARKVGGMWLFETVDASGNVGAYNSIALDAQGRPRISYYDATNSALKYASKNGTAWTVEIADNSGSVGWGTSLALDAQGNPCISYIDWLNGYLRFATRSGGAWTYETVDGSGAVGPGTAIGLDAAGNPRIAYSDDSKHDLKLARRNAGIWTLETVDAAGSVGQYAGMAMDAQGNARMSYYDAGNGDLKYASSAIELGGPAPGTLWPVGAARTITWSGTGRVDLSLSVDGGRTWELLQPRLAGGEVHLIVPHSPTKFAQLKLERTVPYSVSATPGLFSIETSVALLNFIASMAPEGGAQLAWSSDPGPADLAGYRVARSHHGGDYETVVSRTRETAYHDPSGSAGTSYRLFAVNGLGEEILLGEASLRPAVPLAAWPLPYRGGNLSISFATGSGLGGVAANTDVSLYDVSGRLVRWIARGPYQAGYHTTGWDGRDQHGSRVATGVYFLKAEGAMGHRETIRVVVLK